jgi:hypothetical protein
VQGKQLVGVGNQLNDKTCQIKRDPPTLNLELNQAKSAYFTILLLSLPIIYLVWTTREFIPFTTSTFKQAAPLSTCQIVHSLVDKMAMKRTTWHVQIDDENSHGGYEIRNEFRLSNQVIFRLAVVLLPILRTFQRSAFLVKGLG